MVFAYNVKTKKLIELIDLSRESFLTIDPMIVREAKGHEINKTMFKIANYSSDKRDS